MPLPKFQVGGVTIVLGYMDDTRGGQGRMQMATLPIALHDADKAKCWGEEE